MGRERLGVLDGDWWRKWARSRERTCASSRACDAPWPELGWRAWAASPTRTVFPFDQVGSKGVVQVG